jgi:hypothetical protein
MLSNQMRKMPSLLSPKLFLEAISLMAAIAAILASESCVATPPSVILQDVNLNGKYELSLYAGGDNLDRSSSGNVSSGNIFSDFYFTSSVDPVVRVVRITAKFNGNSIGKKSVNYGEILKSVWNVDNDSSPATWMSIQNEVMKHKMTMFLDSVLAHWGKKQYRRAQILALEAILADPSSPWPDDTKNWEDFYFDAIENNNSITNILLDPKDGNIIVFLEPHTDAITIIYDGNSTPKRILIPGIKRKGIDLEGIDLSKEPFYEKRLVALLRDYLKAPRSSGLVTSLRERLDMIVAQFPDY